MTKQKPNRDPAQHKRLIKTARTHGCDGDKERFEEQVKQIAKAKPPPSREPEGE